MGSAAAGVPRPTTINAAAMPRKFRGKLKDILRTFPRLGCWREAYADGLAFSNF
jgi:hypothetical protein